jgi:hypothetical protein
MAKPPLTCTVRCRERDIEGGPTGARAAEAKCGSFPKWEVHQHDHFLRARRSLDPWDRNLEFLTQFPRAGFALLGLVLGLTELLTYSYRCPLGILCPSLHETVIQDRRARQGCAFNPKMPCSVFQPSPWIPPLGPCPRVGSALTDVRF